MVQVMMSQITDTPKLFCNALTIKNWIYCIAQSTAIMLTKKLKKWLPKPEELKQNRTFKAFGPHLADARLWHFNRHSLTKAVYIGVLSAFFPLPGQMLLALIACLYFRANVPMALGLTWITNPITTIPIFYVAYWFGAVLLNEPMISFKTIGMMLSDLSLWIFSDGVNPFIKYQHSFSLSAFLTGLILMAVLSSLICGMAFKYFWHYKTVSMWQERNGYNHQHQFTTSSKKPPNSKKNSSHQ